MADPRRVTVRPQSGTKRWLVRWRNVYTYFERKREAVEAGHVLARLMLPSVLQVRRADGSIERESRYRRSNIGLRSPRSS